MTRTFSAPPPATADEELHHLAINEARDRLCLSRVGIYNMVRDGRLPFVEISNRRRIRASTIRQLIEGRAE